MLNSHDDIGHVGIYKTMDKISNDYWFPKMKVQSCLDCAYHNTSTGKPERFLSPIVSKIPISFHTIHLDHLGSFIHSVRVVIK